ncbi:ribosome biogenesis protein Nop16 [Tuber brumale]|nr:ribosome biogenesis protein Nop16 [Tuber brumale]
MGRQLQKKKNKSSIPKQSKHKNPRIFKVHPTGNALIAANWDRKQTLSQNYRRLGLVSRLGKATGGVEKGFSSSAAAAAAAGQQQKDRVKEKLAPGEARIVRDEEGKVIRVIYGKSAEEALDSDSEEFTGFAGGGGGGEMDFVKKLEAQAAVGERKNRKVLCPGEMDWISRLVEKYGEEDCEGMVRDRKMNVYQQTLGDIRRRVAIWKRQRAEEEKGRRREEVCT